jgi:hypothetical protein
VKDVAVYAGHPEMLQRARNRLAYLRGETAIRIIWDAVILAGLICKLCLKKKIFPFNYARRDRSRHCSPDSFVDIVLTLIRRIESAETGGKLPPTSAPEYGPPSKQYHKLSVAQPRSGNQ